MAKKQNKKINEGTTSQVMVMSTPPELASRMVTMDAIRELAEACAGDISNVAKDVKEVDKKINSVKGSVMKVKADFNNVTLKYMMPKLENETEEEYKDRLEMCTPHYAHDGDIGMDLVAIDLEYDQEHDRYIYHTGLYVEAKKLEGMFLLPRSSNSKTSAYLCNTPGLVDPAQYRGEVKLMFKNRTSIGVRAELEANRIWNNMPWYKKLFKTFDEIEIQCLKYMKEHALAYAPYEIGDHICQMAFMHCPKINLKMVDKLSETERGEGGFGSTGK